jgi:type III restriction enzyme
MKIQFSGKQQYQLDAIQAAVDLFEGQPLAGGPFEFRFESLTGLGFTELGVGNQITLGPDTILANLKAVQQRGSIPQADALESSDMPSLDLASLASVATPKPASCGHLKTGQ